MSRAIRYHPLFEADVIGAAAWNDARNPMIGSAFIAEVSRAVDQLTSDPETRSLVDLGGTGFEQQRQRPAQRVALRRTGCIAGRLDIPFAEHRPGAIAARGCGFVVHEREHGPQSLGQRVGPAAQADVRAMHAQGHAHGAGQRVQGSTAARREATPSLRRRRGIARATRFSLEMVLLKRGRSTHTALRPRLIMLCINASAHEKARRSAVREGLLFEGSRRQSRPR